MARIIIETIRRDDAPSGDGRSLAHALSQLGFAGLAQVRVGARYELTYTAQRPDDALELARSLADGLFAGSRERIVSVRHLE